MRFVFALLVVGIVVGVVHGKEASLSYPPARRVEQFDDFHGTKVADPYRWLEADVRESPEVAAWVAAQNDVARAFLDAIPARESIRRRLTDLWNYPRYSAPWKEGDRYFFHKNDGLQDQAVLYWSDAYDGEERVLIDPNEHAEDGSISLGQTAVSEDGSLLAYCVKEAGSDWSIIEVKRIADGAKLPDRLLWVRWGNIVWNAEGSGFFYSRYPEPPEGAQFQASTVDQKICFHRLGDPQEADELVFEFPEEPTQSFWISRSDDDRHLVLSIARSTDPQNKVYVRPVGSSPDAWVRLIDDFDNQFSFVGNVGDKLYFITDLDAPTKRIVALPADKPGRERLEEIVGAVEATLDGASLLDGKLVCQYLQDVAARVELFTAEGDPLGDVTLPGIGTVAGFDGRQSATETFYMFTGYVAPPAIYRYDLRSGESQLVRAPQVKFDPAQYESRQAFYRSKDGTRIPLIISHKKGLARDGDNPTLLYGYGGFNISITPAFSVEYAVWMDMGGVLAVPNLRGGGEYGEQWHQAGKQLDKQNVFDDFIAAAEWLIAEKYTRPAKLAVMGGSNGGLLVGAVETQRPELFGACLPAVGVMDMLRYHQFTAGHFWRDEFGAPEDPESFRALFAYSPYHNIRAGTSYPPTMIATADTDDRVVPMHSFKYAAAMQAAQGGEAPILLRVETRAGHGAGTPTSKRIDQAADRWAFLWKTLGMGEQPAGEQ
ncbi:MAG: S9 family peptidase [Pirellulales bacterium]|nr:S9 family peptidase [Pirellulales bacterium]